MKRRASPVKSRESTPSTTTPRDRQRLDALSRSGASSLHGMHHDAQKLSTTAFPRSEESESSPGALKPIHRVPSGFPGPGGTGLRPCAHGDGGGYHQGFRHLTTISKRPTGVGYAAWPVATEKRLQNLAPRYR